MDERGFNALCDSRIRANEQLVLCQNMPGGMHRDLPEKRRQEHYLLFLPAVSSYSHIKSFSEAGILRLLLMLMLLLMLWWRGETAWEKWEGGGEKSLSMSRSMSMRRSGGVEFQLFSPIVALGLGPFLPLFHPELIVWRKYASLIIFWWLPSLFQECRLDFFFFWGGGGRERIGDSL